MYWVDNNKPLCKITINTLHTLFQTLQKAITSHISDWLPYVTRSNKPWVDRISPSLPETTRWNVGRCIVTLHRGHQQKIRWWLQMSQRLLGYWHRASQLHCHHTGRTQQSAMSIHSTRLRGCSSRLGPDGSLCAASLVQPATRADPRTHRFYNLSSPS